MKDQEPQRSSCLFHPSLWIWNTQPQVWILVSDPHFYAINSLQAKYVPNILKICLNT